jgi:hypothetical protein
LWCSWRITRDLPDGRAQAGDRHLKIYEPRDNLDVPAWYVLFQGVIGLAQVASGLAMLAGYRRAGVWGAF